MRVRVLLIRVGSGSGLSPWPYSGVLVLAAQVMICSTSLSGGNLVDGLPPASSWAEKDLFINFGRKIDFSIIFDNSFSMK